METWGLILRSVPPKSIPFVSVGRHPLPFLPAYSEHALKPPLHKAVAASSAICTAKALLYGKETPMVSHHRDQPLESDSNPDPHVLERDTLWRQDGCSSSWAFLYRKGL